MTRYETLEFKQRSADSSEGKSHREKHISQAEGNCQAVQLASVEKSHAGEEQVAEDDERHLHTAAVSDAVEENHAPKRV